MNNAGSNSRSADEAPVAGTHERAEPDQDLGPSAVLDRLFAEIGELHEYLRYYLDTKVDSVKLSFRLAGIRLSVLVVTTVAAATALVTGVALLLTGLAGGISELVGERSWAGNLIVGSVLVASTAIGLKIGVAHWKRSSYERTVERYAERQAEQKSKFGYSVTDRVRNGTASPTAK